MRITQSPTFERFVKKQPVQFKTKLDKIINEIVQDPKSGQAKKGDLSDIRVYKFKENITLYLLAYRLIGEELQLIMLGTHENFYRDLKRYIKR